MANTASKSESATKSVARAPLSTDFLVGSWRVRPMFNRIEETQCHSNSGSVEAKVETKTGTIRSLEPRLMHLLCYLAANPERVLSRDELVQELWPDVIVNENSLTRAVSELRKQLAGKTNIVNAYIETIPKKGYRLTAQLLPAPAPDTETEAASESAQATASESTQDSLIQPLLASRLPMTRRLPGQQASLLATACLSVVLSLWLWQSAQIPDVDETLLPVTTAHMSDEVVSDDQAWIGGELTLSNSLGVSDANDLEKSLAVSNDERSLAYIQHNSDSSTIFVASMENLAMAYPVFTSNEKLYNLRWSPVGEALLFASRSRMSTTALFSASPDPAKLMMVDVNTLEAIELLSEEPEPDSAEVMSLT